MTPSTGSRTDDSVSITSVIRSAHTVARGSIINMASVCGSLKGLPNIAMKVAIITDITICMT